MTRKPYILSEEEIESLTSGMINHGDEETYVRMSDKIMSAIDSKDDLDDMLMDMYDTLLTKARNIKDEEIKKILYQLTSMMRILAHQVYRKYIQMGKERDNKRFLHLVSFNKDVHSVS